MWRIARVIATATALAALSIAVASGQNSGSAEPTPTPPVPLAHEPTPATQPSSIPTPPTDALPRRENPDPLHPAGDLIEISIRTQRLTAWRDGRVVHRVVISTGRPGYETPPGHYRILEKYRNRWSRKWSVWMPFAMRWYQGYFIHQLPHKDGSSYNIGASKLGTPDSHGCVRVNVGDAERLFRWTAVGTPVWVH